MECYEMHVYIFFIKLQVIINGMCFQYILCLHKIIDAFHTMKKLRSTFFIFKHFAMLRKEGLPTIKNCVGYHFKTPFAVTNCFLIKHDHLFQNKNGF